MGTTLFVSLTHNKMQGIDQCPAYPKYDKRPLIFSEQIVMDSPPRSESIDGLMEGDW